MDKGGDIAAIPDIAGRLRAVAARFQGCMVENIGEGGLVAAPSFDEAPLSTFKRFCTSSVRPMIREYTYRSSGNIGSYSGELEKE
jgi:hypothetical protein